MDNEEELSRELRACTGPLTLQLPNMDMLALGSCFIIAGLRDLAIAATARHCVEEAITRATRTHAESVRGSPFVVERPAFSWRGIELGTLVPHRNVPPFMSLPLEAPETYQAEASDIAFMLVRPAEEYGAIADLDSSLRYVPSTPRPGEPAVVAGYFDTQVTAAHPRDSDGRAAFVSVHAQYQVVKTRIVEVHAQGLRHLRWPVAKLDCPLFSGMSGGCVLVYREYGWTVMGVVCSDLSDQDGTSGTEAYASLLDPAMDTVLSGPVWMDRGSDRITVRDLLLKEQTDS